MNIEDDKTKKYTLKTVEQNGKKEKKSTKKGKEKKQKKHPKLRLAIKIIFIIIILLILVGIGAFAALFFGDTWNMTENDLVIKMQNSVTYDKEGKAWHEIKGEENRKIIPLSEMGKYIPKAYVAIEDERFYKHNGIDLYRTSGAIFTYIINGGKSSFGGSTITQQLVKNLKEDDDDSIARKIREWSRAYKVEKMLSKSQILELYLNEIFVGGQNVCGIESGAKYYFNKSANKLSLAESAFMAGINDSPNYYNPFGKEDKKDIINNKTKLVLRKMLEVKDENGTTFITQEEYDKAVEEVDNGLKFKQGEFTGKSELSFVEVEAINQVVKDMMEEYDIDKEHAEARVYNNGYKIYTTGDREIQQIMQKEYLKDKYIKKATNPDAEKGAHSQSGMVIIDYKNGQVVGCMGGLGEDSPTYGLNRAMFNGVGRQTGSSIKPLVAVAPALENNVITAATVYDDSKTTFDTYPPGNAGGVYRGLITVRKAIEVSSNIVNIKILDDVGVNKGVEFLNEMGMTQFDESDSSLSLALGGTTHGASPLQMATAYAMIANGGEYIEPVFYTKVEDMNNNVILKCEQETKRIMSEGNAYILSSILKSPVTGANGTAYLCKIPGMDVAAKTGTTDDMKDRWLCGFTPYYAAATWFGYDEPEIISFSNGNPAMNIWAGIMDEIHEDLESANFEKPDNIVKAKICMDSGKAATDECTRTYTEEFVSGTVPGKCDGHKIVEICAETGKLATEYCPEKKKKAYLSTPEKEVNASWNTKAGSKYQEIKDFCDIHTEETVNNIKVINVIGKTVAQAKSALNGLNVQIVYENNPKKANGVVLKQSVAAGKTLKKGDNITLTINEIVEEEEPENPIKNEEPLKNNIDDEQNGVVNTNETV